MLKSVTLALSLALVMTTGARAAMPELQTQYTASSIIKVGEGCGPNRWRDRFNRCHWFGGPGGSYRGTPIECPPGMHIGPRRGACWPN